MIGKDFLFNERLASSYDLIMSDAENIQMFPNIDMEYTAITSVRPYMNIFNVRYSGGLTFNIRLVKDPCSYTDQSEARFTADEINEIKGWLESPVDKSVLRVYPYYDDDTNYSVCYDGIFTSIQPFGWGEECFGLNLTFVCCEPYGYIESGEIYTLSPPTTETKIYVNTSCDEQRYLYPTIEFLAKDNTVFGSQEKIDIKNVSDNNLTMKVKLPAGCTKLILDCKKKIAYGILNGEKKSLNLSDIWVLTETTEENVDMSAQSFVFYWLRFVFGRNTLEFGYGDSTSYNIKNIKVLCNIPYKSGGY